MSNTMLPGIQTGGFSVGVMPSFTPVDPNLVAFNPGVALQGFGQAVNTGNAIEELKARRQHTEETAKTFAARNKLIQAQADLEHMRADFEQKIFDRKQAAEEARLAAAEKTSLATGNKAGREIAAAPDLDIIDKLNTSRTRQIAEGLSTPDIISQDIENEKVKKINDLLQNQKKWEDFQPLNEHEWEMRNLQIDHIKSQIKLEEAHAAAYKGMAAANDAKAQGVITPEAAAQRYGDVTRNVERITRDAEQADKNVVNEDSTVNLGQYRSKMFNTSGAPLVAPIARIGQDPVEKALGLKPNPLTGRAWQELPEGFDLQYTPGKDVALVVEKSTGKPVGEVAVPVEYSPKLHLAAKEVNSAIGRLPRLRSALDFYENRMRSEQGEAAPAQSTPQAPSVKVESPPKPAMTVFVKNPKTGKYEPVPQ